MVFPDIFGAGQKCLKNHNSVNIAPTKIILSLSPGGQVESRGNKELCFCTASLGQTRIQCEAYRATTKLLFS